MSLIILLPYDNDKKGEYRGVLYRGNVRLSLPIQISIDKIS